MVALSGVSQRIEDPALDGDPSVVWIVHLCVADLTEGLFVPPSITLTGAVGSG